MKTIGIVAHSAEGAALCFLTACHEGSVHLGSHMHPNIVMSAVPMGLSMPGWESGEYDSVAKHLALGVQQVADAFICPDNTAHIVLERIIQELPIPGLYIAEVVCRNIAMHGWKRVGLLGTKWTMTGPVYMRVLEERNLEKLIPDETTRTRLNAAIFDELCRGTFTAETTNYYIKAIEDLGSRGAECVILGCTEIPLIINTGNSLLPSLDSTRLLAEYAVQEALSEQPVKGRKGWL